MSVTCDRLYEWGIILYGNDGTWLSRHKQYFEPGMLRRRAGCYFSAILP